MSNESVTPTSVSALLIRIAELMQLLGLTQFITENRTPEYEILVAVQIGYFLKPNTNQISFFCTPLELHNRTDYSSLLFSWKLYMIQKIFQTL